MKVFNLMLVFICGIQATYPKDPGNYKVNVTKEMVNYPANRGKRTPGLWMTPNVPYVINPCFNESQAKMIKDTMFNLERKTCLYFRTKIDMDVHYVEINCGSECSGGDGRSWGKQEIVLGESCFNSTSIILQQLIHILGLRTTSKDPSEYYEYIKILNLIYDCND